MTHTEYILWVQAEKKLGAFNNYKHVEKAFFLTSLERHT